MYKQTKPTMNLESLANELIVGIFEYFHSIPLLHSFHHLNSRFNNLLSLHFQTHPLDLQAISKHDFDRICQEKLSSIIHQITSIRLSDDFDTPDQPLLFYSYGFTLQKFLHLKSLSLYYICSTDLLKNLLSDCHYLTYLKIRKSYFNDENLDMMEICIDQIWSLPKLIYCYLDINFSQGILLPIPSQISQSMAYLSFQHDPVCLEGFADLFQTTPNLRNLSIQLKDSSKIGKLPAILPLLTKLTISMDASVDIVRNLLKNLPSLSYLMIETCQDYINGYEWEEMIVNYLKHLKTFRLMMIFEYNLVIDRILESFQTKFWLEERRWFIRCDCNIDYGTTHLYTLPNKFRRLLHFDPQISKCTCADQKKSASFDCIETLELNTFFEKYTSDLSIQYPNLRHLELSFPFHQIFWSLLPSFHRLKSLQLSLVIYNEEEKDYYFNELRRLFDRATELDSLVIDQFLLSEFSSYKITNQFLRRLDLQASDGYYYGSECIPLIHSFMKDRCEVIFINLFKPMIIIEIVNAMPNLRAMNIQCRDDTWNEKEELTGKDDELVQWLQQYLPSNCSIVRDDGNSSAIRIWIG